MYFADIILNVAWVLFCAGALVFHFKNEARRPSSSGWNRLCRTLAVLLAAVSLFPCVSATDDSIRTEYWNATQIDPHHQQGDQSKKSPEKSLATLVRLLEALESVQISLVWVLSVALCFFALVVIQWQPGNEHFIPRRRGRSPPSSLCEA